ncbi:hypothetical protein [Promicromonospora soli]
MRQPQVVRAVDADAVGEEGWVPVVGVVPGPADLRRAFRGNLAREAGRLDHARLTRGRAGLGHRP